MNESKTTNEEEESADSNHSQSPSEVHNDTKPHEEAKQKPTTPATSPGMIVLQWLTYAFWGWTLLSVSWLLFIIFGNLIGGQDIIDVIPYAIASTLVLLPISLVCDYFYGRQEPAKKTGAASVVMIIHAVIFALFGIGSLISAVLVVVFLLIQAPSDPSGQLVWLYSSLVTTVLYALTFVRTLNPRPSLKVQKWFPIFMAVVTGILIVVAFVGPVARATLTKNDRAIVQYLPDIQDEISDYVYKNSKLPASLGDLTLQGDAQTIIDDNLVEYKQENNGAVVYDTGSGHSYYRYQLCVTYVEEKTSPYGPAEVDGYSDNLFIRTHPKGEVCYKQQDSTDRTKSTAGSYEKSVFDDNY